MRRARVLAFVGAAAAAVGCAGPGMVDLAKLPPAPVAVLYRDERMSLDRVNALNDIEKKYEPSPEEGVVRLETLDALLGGESDAERRLRTMQGSLALVDPATGEARRVEGATQGSRPLAWSPDRSRLLIAAAWRDSSQLFVWDRASETTELATTGPAQHPMGCLLTGGRLVAVEARRVGKGWQAKLLATPSGGGPMRELTPGPGDVLPACSPDAPRIAYVSSAKDGSLVVMALELDAPDAKPRELGHGTDPVFTPDGESVVYAARTVKGQRLMRVRWDGSGRAPVGVGPDDETHPAVSPDGRYVAYVVADPTRRERLRVRRFPDGSGDRPFVETGDATAPAW